jgi:hypothetical protein
MHLLLLFGIGLIVLLITRHRRDGAQPVNDGRSGCCPAGTGYGLDG